MAPATRRAPFDDITPDLLREIAHQEAHLAQVAGADAHGEDVVSEMRTEMEAAFATMARGLAARYEARFAAVVKRQHAAEARAAQLEAEAESRDRRLQEAERRLKAIGEWAKGFERIG